ncbi:ATP-dependent DNA helicase pif1 [Linum perenne]
MHPHQQQSQNPDCRSISSYEAVWRLLTFPIHERSPAVFRLCVHMHGEHMVTYEERQLVSSIVNRPNVDKTMLTEWFTLNQTHVSARQYTYSNITHAFVWDKQCSMWNPRKKRFVIGRVASVPPRSEKFSICVCYTFVSLLIFCQVSSPSELFEKWWPSMADDFRCRLERLTENPVQSPQPETLRNEVLSHLQTLLHTYSTTLCHFGLLSPTSQQLAYDRVEEATLYATSCNTLNHWQQLAHDAIMVSIASDSGKLFFLYGHGGSGKTYLYNCVVAKVRSEGKIALVVASSGIAATLLPGGVTAHSRFKIPINIDHSSTCVIKKGTSLAHLIQQATLIVWDEAPMVNRLSFEAVDRTLCDIMNTSSEGPCYKPFGGKTVILGGDLRQTLPVITHGRREDSLGASLTRSYLWNHCTLLRLHSNMVLAIGDGLIKKNKPKDCTTSDWIEIPLYFMVPPSPNPVATIVACVYSNLQASYQNVAYIRSRAIITPTNKVVATINDYVLGELPGTTKIYLSADTLTTTSSNQTSLEIQYPTKFLNGLSFNGLPKHQLSFKPYCIVMLLRNLNPSAGLCNGTRILLTHLATKMLFEDSL